MNRRFFLSLIPAAALVPFVRTTPRPEVSAQINPAWHNAPYVVHFRCDPRSFERLIPCEYLQWNYVQDTNDFSAFED